MIGGRYAATFSDLMAWDWMIAEKRRRDDQVAAAQDSHAGRVMALMLSIISHHRPTWPGCRRKRT